MTDQALRTFRTLAACLALLASGCVHYTTLTASDLTQRGTRRYADTTPKQATEACATALATLGYPVTVQQTGLVKTGPLVIMRSAYGNASSANQVEDSLGWTITVTAAEGGATLVATPRGYRNQSEMVGDNIWVEEVIGPKFRDLWKEIDANLGTPSHASR